MLKKKLKYKNWDGEEVENTFYFHMSMPELIELEAGMEGGLHKTLNRLVETNNFGELLKLFKKLVLDAYGERDGEHFVKSEELSRKFTQTPAYETLYMELVMNTNAAAEFVNGMMPAQLSEQMSKIDLEEAAAKVASGEEWRLPPDANVGLAKPPTPGPPPPPQRS